MTSSELHQPTSSNAPSKPPIDLFRGWPNPSLLPTSLLRTAAQRALSDPAVSTPGLEYGDDPGYQPLRDSLARWLTDFYHHGKDTPDAVVTADRLCITGGASQNLGSIMSVYTDPSYTRCVWIVAPAYYLAFRIFEDAGLAMRAVPEDDEGPDIDFLRREIEKVEGEFHAQQQGSQGPKYKHDRPWAKTYKHIIYTVPTFANPSSKTTTLQRRKDLVALARETDALVVCDDVYDFLQWPAHTTVPSSSPHTTHLPRILDLDHPTADNPFGNTCSNGSLSKLAGPGLRVGWCEGTPAFAHGVSQAGTTISGGAPSQLTSTYIHLLLESGELQAHIRDALVPAYRRRWAKLMGELERRLVVPLGFEMGRQEVGGDVAGGYFTWLRLPKALREDVRQRSGEAERKSAPAEVLAERCLREADVTIAPGGMFEVPGDNNRRDGTNFGGCIRLCWSWEDEDRLAEGVERIARVAGGMLRERASEKGAW